MLLLATAIVASCGKSSDMKTKNTEKAGTKEAKKEEPTKAKAAPQEKSSGPGGLKANQATATFQGKTLSGLSFQGGVKLSIGYMFTFAKGRIRVMMNVPALKTGVYEADKPGKGLALTLTGAGKPGKFSVRAMRKAKITISKDGDVVEGSYDGTVASPGEAPIPLSGAFRFDRNKIKQ